MKYQTNRGEKIYEDGTGAPDSALLRIGDFVLIAEDVYNLRYTGSGKLCEAYSMRTLHTSEDKSPTHTVELSRVTDKKALRDLTQTVINSQAASYNSTHARRSKKSGKNISDETNPSQANAIRHLEDSL